MACDKVFLGDFNYPNIDWGTCSVQSSDWSYKFIDCLQTNFLIQHVVDPTRARGTQHPHILDLVITSDNFIEELQHSSPIGNSDHSTLKIVCNWSYSKQNVRETKVCYNKGDYKTFNEYIQECDLVHSMERPASVEDS